MKKTNNDEILEDTDSINKKVNLLKPIVNIKNSNHLIFFNLLTMIFI